MGTLYIDVGGSITNSGCTDSNSPLLTGSAATVAASVVTLDGSPDLSGLITSGATQSTIFLADASNSNTKIFWITAVDNALKTVTVSVAPTGVVASVWTIGGRFYLGDTGSPANNRIEAALRAGDTAIVNNSPSPQAATMWTFRNNGTNAVGGPILKGKTGVRPVFTTTNTSNCVASTTSLAWLENIEIVQQGVSGSGVSLSGNAMTIYNVKISQAGTAGVTFSGSGSRVIGCEITGTTTGIAVSSNIQAIMWNFIHDTSGSGITWSGVTTACGGIIGNIFKNCAGRAFLTSGGPSSFQSVLLFYGNTVYNGGNSGLEVNNANYCFTVLNNVFMNNGDAAGEANIEWVAGTGERSSIHGWNTIYSATGVDPINFTLNAQISGTEFATNPLFADAEGGNFDLKPTSPAINAGFPNVFIGALTTGSPSQGAVVPKATSSGSQTIDTSLMIKQF